MYINVSIYFNNFNYISQKFENFPKNEHIKKVFSEIN
jgi:hypothetical protein